MQHLQSILCASSRNHNLVTLSSVHFQIMSIMPTTPDINPAVQPATTLPTLSSSGNPFCTRCVLLASAVKQLTLPQEYPSGQHPAVGPPSSPQRNHPPAQVSVVSGTSLPGTTTVTPPDPRVVDEGAGQSNVSQLRSVRQQPPPWVARQP